MKAELNQSESGDIQHQATLGAILGAIAGAVIGFVTFVAFLITYEATHLDIPRGWHRGVIVVWLLAPIAIGGLIGLWQQQRAVALAAWVMRREIGKFGRRRNG
jgi:integral membrane sensor domain MASE1